MRRRSLRLMFFSLVGPLVACTFGPRLKTFPLAHGPQGAKVTVTAGSERLRGELLEVRGDGLLLLTELHEDRDRGLERKEQRLVLVGYAVMQHARFEALDESLSGGETPETGKLDRLRRISRFPQGLQPDLLEKLLRDCGQQELEIPRP